LGLERSATHGQVSRAYLEAIALLFPAYSISIDVPAGIAPRVERAFNKASQAFSVLASFNRRKDYDAALSSIASKTQSLQAPKPAPVVQARSMPQPEHAESEVRINRIESQPEAYKEFAKKDTNDNRRRCERFKLGVPARVTGHDRKSGKWHEMTETVDVS